MTVSLKAIAISLTLLGLGTGTLNQGSQPGAGSRLAKPSDQVHLVDERPVSVKKVSPGVFLVDFGKVAFGNVAIKTNSGSGQNITVHFGESLTDGRINRRPPGTVRYATTKADLRSGQVQVIAPPPDARNTEVNNSSHPPAILTPKEWGVLVPFRWVEIEGWQGDLRSAQIKRRSAFAKSWNERESDFECSDPMLNQVWDLCKYSIKATTFAGLFVDGDRERIPYEADAYLNQLSYYATTSDVQMPRATFDHLMSNGTWPTEWSFHMVFVAYADWMQTQDRAWLATRYDSLKSKLQSARIGVDGLVHSSSENIKRTDIVDWPTGERDGYEFGPRNTVVNAFYVRSLGLMAIMGKEFGRETDASHYATLERNARAAFQSTFFDASTGLYKDGADSQHQSLHANLFPLAFNLVPASRRERVASWLVDRGMKCSVYAAQYLLEGLFEAGFDSAALDLILAPGDRSWKHMVESGTTITWEAWDQKYKPNQDWNHAWGAAPANLLPKYVLGVQPLAPGFKKVSVKPNLGTLSFAKGTVPTPEGSIRIDWKRTNTFTLTLRLPKGTMAAVDLPALADLSRVFVNGNQVTTTRSSTRIKLDREVSGLVKIELQK